VLAFAAILPHGSDAIPELAGEVPELFGRVRQGLQEAARWFHRQSIDVVMVATPHGIRAEGALAISLSERTEGVLEARGVRLAAHYVVDRDLAQKAAESAVRIGMPAARLAYGAASGPANCLPLDWGAQVPLHFLLGPESPVPVVTIVPSRLLSFADLARFGESLAEALEADRRRIAFIASSDLCHAHLPEGPYGYHPNAAELDALIQRAVERDRLEDLIATDPELIRTGKPDGLWQIAILTGVRRRVDLESHYCGYDVPTYFGMLSAAYTRA
jgi:aromatic ring-opening dioxygenase LigB subunit